MMAKTPASRPALHTLGEAFASTIHEPPFRRDAVATWRNIPDCVRDAFVGMLDYTERLSGNIQALAVSLSRKSNETDIKDMIQGKASMNDLDALSKFVRTEIAPRLDEACPSHAASQRLLHQQAARLAQLESIVAQQEKTIQQLQKDVSERVKVVDLASRGYVDKPFVDDLVSSAVKGLAHVSYVDTAVVHKADNSTIDVIVKDLHLLHSQIQERIKRADVDEVVEKRCAAAVTTARAAVQPHVDNCVKLLAEMRKSVDSKAGKDEAPGVWKAKLASVTAAIESKLSLLKEEVMKSTRELLDEQVTALVDAMNKKAYKADVTKALLTKVDAATFDKQLAGKLDASVLNEQLARKADISDISVMKKTIMSLSHALLSNNASNVPSVMASLHTVSDAPEIGSVVAARERSAEQLRAIADLQAEIDSLRHEIHSVKLREPGVDMSHLISKADRSDVDQLATGFTTMRSRVEAIQQELAVLASRFEASAETNMHHEERIATQPVAAVAPAPAVSSGATAGGGGGGAVAKWVWKQRMLTPETSAVMWDVESLNSSKENFLWSNDPSEGGDASIVQTTKPGVYRVSCAFFAASVPSITVLVNGFPAFSTAPPEEYTEDGEAQVHSKVGDIIIHSHPNGSVAGLSVSNFVALPKDAEISVLYNGDVRGQGFLELVKL